MNKEFFQLLVKEKSIDLLVLREYLVNFKQMGMDKYDMIENLEKLKESNPEIEDTILELMDFVVGYCQPQLSIFNDK